MYRNIIICGMVFCSILCAQIWQESNGPLRLNNVNSFVINAHKIIFASGIGKIGRSTDNGLTWQPVYLKQTGYLGLPVLTVRDNDVYAGVYSSGVYRSTNDGSTWKACNNGLTSLNITSIISNANGSIYTATDEGIVFISNDEGTTWIQTGTALPGNLRINCLAAFNDVLLAGTDGGIYRSIDNGANWNLIQPALTNVNSLKKSPAGDIFAGSKQGLSRSTDQGNSWKLISVNWESSWFSALFIDTAGVIYAGPDGKGVFRSTNNGDDWVSLNLSGTSVSAITKGLNGTLLAGISFSDGVFRSTDNGTTWNQMISRFINPGSRIQQLSINSRGELFVRGYPATMYRSTDHGQHWDYLLGPYAMEMTPMDDIYVVQPPASLYHSLGDGTGWTKVYDFGAYWGVLSANGKGNVIGQSYGGGRTTTALTLKYSTNHGATWSTAKGPYGDFGAGLGLTVVAFGSSSDVFTSVGSNLFRSTDLGATWSTPVTSTTGNILSFYTSKISGNEFTFGASGIFRSTNNGMDWSPMNSGLPTTNVRCNGADSKGSIYVAIDSGLYRSTDEGNQWTQLGISKQIAAVSFDLNGNIYAAATDGVYRSMDNGKTFVLFNDGLPGSVPWIQFDTSGYAYTAYNGFMYRTILPVSMINGVHEQEGVSLYQFALSQNYPNPFNGSTTIKFTVDAPAVTTLRIYDLLGREVTVLADERMTEGRYARSWNPQSLPSGVYFYTLHSGSMKITKKLVFLK